MCVCVCVCVCARVCVFSGGSIRSIGMSLEAYRQLREQQGGLWQGVVQSGRGRG